MYFEQLPNELIYEIFNYLDIFSLYRIFSHLNIRLNTILNHLTNISFQINSSEDTNDPLIHRFAQQIISLHIFHSNCIDFILFSHIRSLNIRDYLSERQLTQIRYENFPKLVYLNMPFINESDESYKFFQRIFSNEFPHLNKCIFGDISSPNSKSSWSISPSIRSLISTGFCLSTYIHILHSCPNLTYLHWSIVRYSDDEHFPRKHFHLQHLYLRTINLETIRFVLDCVPNLKRLFLVSDWSRGNNCSSLNFEKLAEIFEQYVPNLCHFDCNTMERNPMETKMIRNFHRSFQRIQSEVILDGRTRFFTFCPMRNSP
ncbi:unnamed protein product [Adineta ricciae]|nr:unnamed protein product [Adineta ricciae]